MSRCFAALAVLLAAVLLAACGGKTQPKPIKLPPSVVHACPQALHGEGHAGECAPPQVKKGKR